MYLSIRTIISALERYFFYRKCPVPMSNCSKRARSSSVKFSVPSVSSVSNQEHASNKLTAPRVLSRYFNIITQTVPGDLHVLCMIRLYLSDIVPFSQENGPHLCISFCVVMSIQATLTTPLDMHVKSARLAESTDDPLSVFLSYYILLYYADSDLNILQMMMMIILMIILMQDVWDRIGVRRGVWWEARFSAHGAMVLWNISGYV